MVASARRKEFKRFAKLALLLGHGIEISSRSLSWDRARCKAQVQPNNRCRASSQSDSLRSDQWVKKYRIAEIHQHNQRYIIYREIHRDREIQRRVREHHLHDRGRDLQVPGIKSIWQAQRQNKRAKTAKRGVSRSLKHCEYSGLPSETFQENPKLGAYSSEYVQTSSLPQWGSDQRSQGPLWKMIPLHYEQPRCAAKKERESTGSFKCHVIWLDWCFKDDGHSEKPANARESCTAP